MTMTSWHPLRPKGQRGCQPISNLTITRKISKSEKTLVDLKIGKIGQIVSYYYGISSQNKPIEVKSGDYHIYYYLDKLNDVLDKMLMLDKLDKNEQWSLF